MSTALRVSLQGTLPGGEVFSINPVYNLADYEPTSAEALAIATAIDAVAVPAAVLQMVPSAVAWTGTRVEARDVTGALISVGEHTKTSSQTGTSVSVHPFQTSMVASLRSTTAGASGRGRLYFPAQGIPLTTSTLRVTTGNLDAALAGVVVYLTNIEAAIQTVTVAAALSVWSRKNSALYLVNEIQMGDVPDVQRRRRDTVVENYSSDPYTGV